MFYKTNEQLIFDLLETIPEFTELKLQDAKLIVDYFLLDLSRTEICAHSGANLLRVDPIIIEFIFCIVWLNR